MNNTIACAALIAAGCMSTGAHAQQVTMYGLLDLGVAYTTNANAAGDSIVKMPSLTASLPSRIGFRGSEDLGAARKPSSPWKRASAPTWAPWARATACSAAPPMWA
jgi:predicted porin